MRLHVIRAFLLLAPLAIHSDESINEFSPQNLALWGQKKAAAEKGAECPIPKEENDSRKQPSHPVAKAPCSYDHRVQIGGNYTYAWITPEGSSSVTGSLGGLQAIYEYRPLDSFYGAAAFSYRAGTTTNDVGSRGLQDFNQQARLGYTFPQIRSIDRLALFSGFGARYMAEDVSVGSTSLDFDYTTFYIPVGFLWEKKVIEWFSIGCNFQWMAPVLPMVRIDLLDGAQWDLTYELLNFCVEIPFIFSLDRNRYTLSINPFFESWRDGHSTAETLTRLTLSLPGNKYLFTGVNVNFGFSF